MRLLPAYSYELSILLISFNTRGLTRDCLRSLLTECERLPSTVTAEILVVDNASRDGSAAMVAAEFAHTEHPAHPRFPVRLLPSDVNLGFGAANNVALEAAQGHFLVLLNTDAFFEPHALALALEHMTAHPETGLGGARLISRDGALQPSARSFHTIWRDVMVLTGMAGKFPRSRVCGALDRTWADPLQPAAVDWVPGAFSIIRREALVQAGIFDPAFFLYYEEVDLCRRIKAAGWEVRYWPDVVVTHIGGESSRQLSSLTFSKAASQVVKWRMRSTLLYYRKHHGGSAWLAYATEWALYALRRLRNARSAQPARRQRAEESAHLASLLRDAWRETRGGRVSPARPW